MKMKIYIILILVSIATAVVSAKRSGKGILRPECPKKCDKIWLPVCAKLNGIQVNISSKCRLEELIACSSSKKRIWEFLHDGHCNKDGAMMEGDDADSEADANEAIERKDDLLDLDEDFADESELLPFLDEKIDFEDGETNINGTEFYVDDDEFPEWLEKLESLDT